ncbi:DndE family protein [Flavobacteriaceae bacterium Ap0902]|nr:DndE family protein [Flavobacteriaceae bacterium Ap0902]
MFTQIRTSKANKEIVSKLSRKLNLGTENIIARIALGYSLSKGQRLSLENVKDSSGKEYSKKVLFAGYEDYYIGLICVHYNISSKNKDIPKYIKMHIDDGLELINDEIEKNPNIDGFDFIIEKIEGSIN